MICGRVPDVHEYVKAIGEEYGLSESSIETATRAVEEFLESAIYQEVRLSTSSYTEVPFAVNHGGPDPTTVQGRIDLVYRSEAGWKIVDFKTDSVATDDEVDQLLDHYRSQIASYAEHWETITGETVAEKGLWLTAQNRYVQID